MSWKDDYTEELYNKLISDLKSEEGFSSTPYRDSRFIWTIGWGLAQTTDLTDRQIEILGTDKIKDVKYITREQGEELLEIEIAQIIDIIEQEEWIMNLPIKKIVTIIKLIFNMGWSNFNDFKNTIKALKDGNWIEAMIELLDARLTTQIKGRALKNAFELAGVDMNIEDARRLYKILKGRIK